MPGQVRPVVDERDALLSYLAQQRLVLRLTAFGLTEEQAGASASTSPLSVGGLIKHLTDGESAWIDLVLGLPFFEMGAEDDYADNFRFGPDDTLEAVLAAYDAVAARTEAVISAIDDMGQPVPVPSGVPWFPQDVEAWSVRWVLLHLIEETARHAGHADIVRESIDGAVAFPLMAAAEGWEPTPWIQPWRPSVTA
jgi:uncharacterized damage-inducible protein DinB